MSDTAPGPGTTSSRVRLPIDEVIDDIYERLTRFPHRPETILGMLSEQTPYVVAGVLRKHRAQRDGA